MVSLTTQPFTESAKLPEPHRAKKTVINVCCLTQWNSIQAWKHSLNNIRLLIQPLVSLWLISPWLEVFPNRSLLMGFHKLIQSVTHLHTA